MKIFHVNMANYGGGLEQYLEQLFKELYIRGHKNFFLYGQACTNEQLPNYADKYHIDKITHFQCHEISAKLVQVNKILETIDPDIIFIHQVLNPGLINLLTSKRPSVRFVHGFKLICPEGSKTLNTSGKICKNPMSCRCQLRAYTDRCMPRNPLIGLPLILKSMGNARRHKERSHMVVASEFMKSVLLQNGFENKQIAVVPYFTYLPKLTNDARSNNLPSVLALGRIVKAKGMHHLLFAFSKLRKKMKLVIVGDGPELPQLKRLAKKLGLVARVSFCGWTPHDQLDRIYDACSLVVVPSMWPEPFGIVGIEAMAHQKPVVAYDVGGISEWLQNGKSGFLVKAQDKNELAQKINFILDRQDTGEQMGRKGREMVKKRFSPERHIKELLKIFEKAIAFYKHRA